MENTRMLAYLSILHGRNACLEGVQWVCRKVVEGKDAQAMWAECEDGYFMWWLVDGTGEYRIGSTLPSEASWAAALVEAAYAEVAQDATSLELFARYLTLDLPLDLSWYTVRRTLSAYRCALSDLSKDTVPLRFANLLRPYFQLEVYEGNDTPELIITPICPADS